MSICTARTAAEFQYWCIEGHSTVNVFIVFAVIALVAFGYLTYHRGWQEALAATAALGAAIAAALYAYAAHFLG